MKYYETLFRNANPDLFYDSQIINKSLTWRLVDSESNEIVLAGILNDTDNGFNYTVTHEYSGSNSLLSGIDSAIKGGVNQVLNTARDVSMAGGSLRKLLSNQGKEGETGNAIRSWLDKADQWMTDRYNNNIQNEKVRDVISTLTSELGGAMYGSFVSAFDFVKVFQGTSVDISLPNLDIILFDYDDCSIYDTVDELNNKFLGDFSTSGEVSGVNVELWGVQKAPNDYRPDFSTINNVVGDKGFKGTFSLYLGDKYKIKNLVVNSFSVNLSQFNRKGFDRPLYAEVSLQLGIASFVSKSMLKECIETFKVKDQLGTH